MSNHCKCLKCQKAFNLNDIPFIKKITKNGCPSCQNKNFEWDVYIEEIRFHYTTDVCHKCSQVKITDILNWEELKPISIRKGIKTKQAMVKKMNDEGEETCYCGIKDKPEREREREHFNLLY